MTDDVQPDGDTCGVVLQKIGNELVQAFNEEIETEIVNKWKRSK